MKLKKRLIENIEAYSYLSPALIILFVFWFIPIIFSFYLSFSNWGPYTKISTVKFVGLANYIRLLGDKKFIQSLVNTTYYVMFAVPTAIALSLFIAILLNQKIKGLSFYRTAYFIPYITSLVAVAIVWQWIFNREYGLANYIFEQIGIPQQKWLRESTPILNLVLGSIGIRLPWYLGGPSLSMCCIIILTVWQVIGYNIVIFLAGLQNIDKAFYEAAEIDGASIWQKFKYVTIPLLSPTTFFIALISVIFAYKAFVPMFVMTPDGGPDNTTTTIVFYIYRRAWELDEFGYASALAYILLVIILLLTLIQNKIFGKKVHYD